MATTTSSRKRRRLDTDASSPSGDSVASSQALRSDIITLVCPIDKSALANNNGATGELTAHRNIVELSPVWKSALHCGLQEERNRKIIIKDFTIDTVETMLVTLYRREFGNDAAPLTIPLEDAQKLLICAAKYGLDHTKRLAEDRLIGAVSLGGKAADTDLAGDDIALLYRFARDYDAPRLVAECAKRLNAIFDEILPPLLLPDFVDAAERGLVSKLTTVEPAIPQFDTTAIFEFVHQLTDSGADEVLQQRVPAAIARHVEWLHRVVGASALSRRFSCTPIEEKRKLKNLYRQHVLPIIKVLASAEEISVARPAVRAIIRDAVCSRRLVFLELLVSEIRIADPDSNTATATVTESDSASESRTANSDADSKLGSALPQLVLDEKLLQKQIFTSSIQLYVEYRDIVDASGATVACNDAEESVIVRYRQHVAGPRRRIKMKKCDAFSKEWRQKWSGVAVPHNSTSNVGGCSGSDALLTFLKKTNFAGQDFNWDAIEDALIKGLGVGVECKPGVGAAQPTAGIRWLIFNEFGYQPCRDGDLSTEPICRLLELAGYQLQDTANLPTSLKLVVMDLRAMMRAIDDGRDVPWVLGCFGVGDKWRGQRCTMEDFRQSRQDPAPAE